MPSLISKLTHTNLAQLTTERGWLIERRNANNQIEWARFDEYGVKWVNDSTRACRFCRREDAEQLAYGEDCYAITEHIWDSGKDIGQLITIVPDKDLKIPSAPVKRGWGPHVDDVGCYQQYVTIPTLPKVEDSKGNPLCIGDRVTVAEIPGHIFTIRDFVLIPTRILPGCWVDVVDDGGLNVSFPSYALTKIEPEPDTQPAPDNPLLEAIRNKNLYVTDFHGFQLLPGHPVKVRPNALIAWSLEDREYVVKRFLNSTHGEPGTRVELHDDAFDRSFSLPSYQLIRNLPEDVDPRPEK
jgi:hypothetical protein